MIPQATLGGTPQPPVQPPSRASAPWPRRLCPECLTPLLQPRPNQLFCTTEHKRAHERRMAKRGAVLGPIYAAARTTRDGTRGGDAQRAIGKRASADCGLLQQQWREEDEAAGRMPALEYIALRYRHGFVEVVR